MPYKQERKSEKERILLERVKQQERTTMRENLVEAVENNKRWKGRDSWGSDLPNVSEGQAKFKRKPRTLVKRKIRRKLREVGGRSWEEQNGKNIEKVAKRPKSRQMYQRKNSTKNSCENYEKCRWRIEENKVRSKEVYKSNTVTATEYERSVPYFLFFSFMILFLKNIIHEALESSILCHVISFNP